MTVGNTIPTDSRFAYVARVASIQAGLPMESVAMSVNRLCSSGLQGIVTTAQNILLGDCDYGVGGGVEVMSRGGYLSTAMRSGARMGDTKLIDMMVATLTDPFGVGHMGITAENLAAKWGITREEQDALAVESHRRAAAAIAEGRFKSQIVPIVKQTRKGEVTFDTDEHVKAGTTAGDAGEDEAGVQEGRLGDGRQRLGHQRRRGLLRAGRCGGGGARPATSRWRGWCRTRWPACRTRSWAKARSRRPSWR